METVNVIPGGGKSVPEKNPKKAGVSVMYDRNHFISRIENEQNRLLELCSSLIRIPSVNPPGEMETITRFICSYLEEHKIPYEVLYPVPGTPNIVATLGKKGGRRLLLNGHSDVVPPGNLEQWDFDPFCGEVRDGKIYGRGASDMKCGLAGLLFAMGLIADEGVELDGELVLTVVPDEEVSGEWGTKWLVESGTVKGDACIIAEPSGYFNCEIGQKGCCWLKLEAEGAPAHGSLAPFVGDNAIEKLMKVLAALPQLRSLPARYDDQVAMVMEHSKQNARRRLSAKGAAHVLNHCSVNIGKIQGGTKINMVPDHAEAEVDIRVPLGISTQTVEEEINRIICETGVQGVTYSFSWRSEPNHTPRTAEIVETLAKNVEEIWNEPLTRTYQWASSDARFFRYAGIPTLQYGPSTPSGIHAYNETAEVRDVVNITKVYLCTMLDYLHGQQP